MPKRRKLALAVVATVGLTGCSSTLFIAREQERHRLAAAVAIGAVDGEIDRYEQLGPPPTNNRAAFLAWQQANSAQLAQTAEDQRQWQSATAQLNYLPDNAPGPTATDVENLNGALRAWMATRQSRLSSLNGCLTDRRWAASRRCINRVQAASQSQLASTQAAVDQAIITIRTRMTTSATASPQGSDTTVTTPSSSAG